MSVLEEKLAAWRKQTDEAPPPGLLEKIVLAPPAVRPRLLPRPPRRDWRRGLGLFAAAFAGTLIYAGTHWPPSRTYPHEYPGNEGYVLSSTPIEQSFGLGDGVDYERADQKVFDFEFRSPVKVVVLLHFQARDISADEVMVSVNGTDVGFVPPDTLAVNERSNELLIPPSALVRNGKNKVIFDNVRNPPGRDPWRIWNVWTEVFPLPELGREEIVLKAQQDMRRGQDFWDRREVGPENLYKAWRAFRDGWLVLESIEGQKPMEYPVARDKMREAQLALDRLCSKLLLEAQQYYNMRNYELARATLEHVNEYFPRHDQVCPSRAEWTREDYGL